MTVKAPIISVAATLPDVQVNAPDKATPPVEQPKVNPPPETPKVTFNDKEKMPASWDLKPHEDGSDRIQASHTVTLKQFEGTVKEFNALLRG